MIEPIVDESSHKRALERIEALWEAAAGTAEGAELDALATLVEAYERKTVCFVSSSRRKGGVNWPVPSPGQKDMAVRAVRRAEVDSYERSR